MERKYNLPKTHKNVG
jgi:serine/threonine protein kinase